MNAMLNTVMDAQKIERVDTPIRFVLDNVKIKATFENVAVVGLGYVGLPLAVCLAEQFQNVAGFDISKQRVAEINNGYDATNELTKEVVQGSGLTASTEASSLADASFFIVTVPTPINNAHQPDLSPLQSACNMVGPYLKKGDIVVFESTVYPGVTEDYCAPILEKLSGLKAGEDFGLGYSPERINPGDKANTVENTIKVVSGDSQATIDRVIAVYDKVIKAGLHVAPTIKVAEASKVLENTQRDINIALMNEMSQICDKVGIETNDVIEAAGTKWNFLKFTPGLVGGHCIGVDPYYLASLAEQVGHHPQVILAGRRTNDGMVRHVADTTLRMLIKKAGDIREMRIGVCGISFKENVPDIRNSKALEVVDALRGFGITPLVHDPHCSPDVAVAAGYELCTAAEMSDLDAMVLATPHNEYIENPDFLKKIKEDGILVDVRGVYRDSVEAKELRYWSL